MYICFANLLYVYILNVHICLSVGFAFRHSKGLVLGRTMSADYIAMLSLRGLKSFNF